LKVEGFFGYKKWEFGQALKYVIVAEARLPRGRVTGAKSLRVAFVLVRLLARTDVRIVEIVYSVVVRAYVTPHASHVSNVT
jgi:hypothetical protein